MSTNFKKSVFASLGSMLAIAVLFSITACNYRDKAARGKAILEDKELFDLEETKDTVKMYELLQRMNAKDTRAGHRLTKITPEISKIKEKYGDPDYTSEQVVLTGENVVVYFYGPFGLCVNKNAGEGQVIYILLKLPT